MWKELGDFRGCSTESTAHTVNRSLIQSQLRPLIRRDAEFTAANRFA